MLETFKKLPTEPPYAIDAPSSKYMEVQKDGLRFRVSGSQPRDQNGRCRTEIRIRDPKKKSRGYLIDPDGSDRWSAVEFKIPNDWDQEDPNKVVFHQWHHLGSAIKGKAPPLQCFLWKKNLTIRECHAAPGKDPSPANDLYKVKAIKEHWYRLVAHTVWSVKGKGFIQMWLDGKQIIKYKGVVGYAWAMGTFESVGLYWPGPTLKMSHTIMFREWERLGRPIEP